ncbi:aldehyde dehydrogenase family protein [Candidatus Micrarchaeota archaeon]|nr:aldehyde dehydrogenase family protein [Candidatus Micrarchaeota archaeon]MBU1166473.1 aldehyde dehydrogenase family protein [Candidatus Micrarchaeota archaeon]MBU1886179.1 aldehyde dehydrogenase family protein [Candidatus Micrarchaeota archaeon]
MADCRMYIDGKWIGAKTSFETINPTTEKVLARFPKGNEKDVDRAVKAAQKAFKKWSKTPPPIRGQILFRVAELLRKNKKRLGRIVATEMGKVLPEALGDVQEAIDTFEYFGAEGRRLFGNTTTSELKDKFAMTIRRPVGVCGLVSPWNFPVAIPAWKLAPALICGNTVVFKPSSDTPLCAHELVKILIEAGVPPSVVNFVTGSASDVGQAIVTHPEVECLSFTGSKDTGEWIVANAGLKKVGMELGGKNPIIVMDDADLELAVEGILWGAFGTTGQRCTACSRAIVHRKIKDRLLNALVEKAKKLRTGNPILKTTDVGPLINENAVEKVERYVEIGKDEDGAKLLCGGEKPKGTGYFYRPTIFDDVEPDMRIAREEIFGPVLSVLEFERLDKAIEIANNIEYGLSSSIYTKNVNNAFKAIEGIDAGLTYINSSTIGSEVHLPFGGVKKTGHTKEAGIMGLDEFSNVKTVYFDYSGKLQKAQIDD